LSGEDAGMSASESVFEYHQDWHSLNCWWRQKGHLAKIAPMHY